MSTIVPRREEIAAKDTWDVESVFATESAWEKAITEVREALTEIERFRGRLHEGPKVLADALEAVNEFITRVGRVYVYAQMVHDADTEDQSAAAKSDRAMALISEALAALAFVDPELLGIGLETLRAWAGEDSRLRTFDHYFERLEVRRAHVRSAEVEEIVGLAANPFGTARSTHAVLADTDLRFEPATSSNGDRIEISQGNIDALLSDSDREVRKSAWENYPDAHLAYRNTMASCLSAGVKQDVFHARVHGYGSSLEAALAPSHIPVEVFRTVLDTYRKHLPTWHKYWRLRRESLGYDSFHVYDIKAPMILDQPKVLYSEAVDWIVKGMQPLGAEYVEVLRRGVEEQRWVDIYPNQGKRSGAYSAGVQGTHPFILMSYTDDVLSMSTLAHELGHSLHSFYTWESQPPVYANYSIFVAEVASNFNQALVRQYLFESNPDSRFQIALIDEAMANFHRYFFIMPILALFELEIHERTEKNQPLTADGLNALLAELFREGYGDEVVFDADRIGITWAQFSTHLYANFYVFQYATGIAAAHALVDHVREGGDTAVGQYLEMLKAGDSVYPLDALRNAGVDMTSPAPVEAAFRYLDELVDRLAGLLAQGTHTATHAR